VTTTSICERYAGFCGSNSEVIGHCPFFVAVQIVPSEGIDRNSRDLSGFCESKTGFIGSFRPRISCASNRLPPTTICFDLVFESFLQLRCFSCLLGLAVSASLASSSGVSVSRGFPGFLVRVAWSVPVPGELSCCGVCGGLLCVGGLLACASGVFGSVVPGALLLARVLACVGGLRPWPRWFVRALPWRLLSGRFCRAFPVAWRSVSGGLRVPVRSVWPAGSVRSGVSLLSSDGRFAGGLSVSCPRRCSLPSVLGVAGLRQLLGRRLATSAGVFWGGLVHRRLRFHPPSPSVFLVVAGLVDGGLASLLRFPLRRFNPFL